jgi:hypothetical protein
MYRSPEALRAALKDRLAALSAVTSGRHVPQLQRQFAYDRLLARVFVRSDAERWVLKGAGALLARLATARHSVDLDLYHRDDLAAAEFALRAAAQTDLDDFFTFDLARAVPLAQAGAALRVPTTAYLGQREYARFHVDLVVGIAMTGEPDRASSIVDLEIPGLTCPPYRVYPLPDHIADKVAAIHETHGGAPSTRVKDLVDLVLISTTQTVPGRALSVAIRSESLRRGLTLPTTVTIPSVPAWNTTYRTLAATVPALAGHPTVAAATVVVRALIDPVLNGRASGVWRPDLLAWDDGPVR